MRYEMRYEIKHDEWAESPREWSNLGRMGCHHNKYHLGDLEWSHTIKNIVNESGSWTEVKDALIEEANEMNNPIKVILPLNLYDHSGISMSIGEGSGWDNGVVGFIWATQNDILEWFQVDSIDDEILERTHSALNAEVSDYDTYIRGEVYEYIIYDDNDEVIESCCGFFGYEDAEKEAEAMIKLLEHKNAIEALALYNKAIIEGHSRRVAK